MTLFTLAAVVLIFLTLRDTRQMVIDTREIGQAQVRAHLHLEIVDTRINAIEIDGVEKIRAVFKCKIMNSGNSPAHQLSVLYDIFQTKTGEVKAVLSDGSELPQAHKSMSAIPSQGSAFIELKGTFLADIATLRDGGSHIALSYVLKCVDVFNLDAYEPLVSGYFMEHPAGSGNHVFAQHLIVTDEGGDQLS
jgi:hypothetical protein